MPQKEEYGFIHQDLEVLTITNKKVAQEKAKKAVKTPGQSDVKRKYTGNNKMKKLEEETENIKVEKVNKSISTTIRDQRMKLNLKQKDLANKVRLPVATIQKYENGSAIPDIKVLITLEKYLKCKLTGKGFTK